MIQRRTPLKRGTKALKRTPVRKVSKKRAKEARIYSEKRKAFLDANPICQVWLKVAWGLFNGDEEPIRNMMKNGAAPRSVDVHHVSKRTGSNYLDESTWLAVCRENHELIHNNPSWARANGFLK